MTSEVAILNRSGVAIAADSAVTIGGERVWMSSNKIFSLGPNQDIAVMIFGAGDFVGCPWELIIKSFKTEYSSNRFDTVDECFEKFSEYIKDARW